MPEANTYRRIIAFVSFGPQDAQVVRQASLLAKAHGAQLRLLHIVDVDASLDGGSGLTPAQEAQAYAAVAMPRLQALAQADQDIATECHVRVGAPGPAFQQLAGDWMPDLVVTTRDAQYVAQGPWDTLILNGPSSWLGNLLNWNKGRSAELPAAATI